jgi:hypothetical protein
VLGLASARPNLPTRADQVWVPCAAPFSLHPEPELLHDAAPQRAILLDRGGIILRRVRPRRRAVVDDALADRLVGECVAQLRVQPFDDRPRRSRGRQQAIALLRDEAGQSARLRSEPVGWVEFFTRPNDPNREMLGLGEARPNL